jgi:arsenite-transporting ATPase
MAAATALASAAGGATTLVVSTDPAHSLSDTLDVAVPAEPTQVREDVPLYAAEIDPEAAVEGSVLGAMGGGVDGDGDGDGGSMGAPFAGAGPGGADAFEGFGEGGDGANPLGGLGGLGGMAGDAASMPGADEAAAMQTLLRYMDDPRFDRVVVDTAPTGHTLRLLELPEFLDSMTGRLLTLRERLGGMMSGLNPFGDDAGEGDVDLEALRERVERLRAVLRDPSRTDFRVVLVPEEMSVVESERLVRRLREFEIPVGTVVVNRVMEGLDEVADVEAAGIDPGWVVTPDLESCAFCERRWQVQQRALARASDLFRGHDVARVPLLADEVRGEEALRVVAACLTA